VRAREQALRQRWKRGAAAGAHQQEGNRRGGARGGSSPEGGSEGAEPGENASAGVQHLGGT
jgi:hypothetical protein